MEFGFGRRGLVITFLFLETSNIYFIHSQRVSGLQKYIGSWWQNWKINTALGNLMQVPYLHVSRNVIKSFIQRK